jgi:hypothetical protein
METVPRATTQMLCHLKHPLNTSLIQALSGHKPHVGRRLLSGQNSAQDKCHYKVRKAGKWS